MRVIAHLAIEEHSDAWLSRRTGNTIAWARVRMRVGVRVRPRVSLRLRVRVKVRITAMVMVRVRVRITVRVIAHWPPELHNEIHPSIHPSIHPCIHPCIPGRQSSTMRREAYGGQRHRDGEERAPIAATRGARTVSWPERSTRRSPLVRVRGEG